MSIYRDFELFFKENYSRFYFFAYQMIGEREICRDIVSDSFESIWSVILSGNKERELNWSKYMYSLVRNKCVDYIRHETAKGRYANFYLHMFGNEEEEETDDETERQIEIMYHMLSEFTPQTARILELCYFQKKTYNEAAEELHISASAVKKHIVGALKAFRTRLKEP